LLTIVFGFRNRELLRVKRCLESLKNQTYKGFEVIFVDYGSESDVSNEVSKLVRSFDFCEYVYSETRGWAWNRSRALNIGVRLSKTKYVMTSDIDIIFDSGFIAQNMNLASNKYALHAFCYFLPKRFKKWGRISSLRHTFKQSNTSALGLLLLSKENHEKIGAFDEYYQFWGIEDQDLEHRLNSSGINTKWLDCSESRLYHQWHPVNNNTMFSYLPFGYWEDAKMYFGKNFANQKRNTIKPWGRITFRDQRPALDLLEGIKYPTQTFSVPPKQTFANIAQNIAKSFYGMTAGDTLCLKTTFKPAHGLVLGIINFMNKAATKIGIDHQLITKRDLLRDAFWFFYRENEEEIIDYAITTDEKCYYMIKK